MQKLFKKIIAVLSILLLLPNLAFADSGFTSGLDLIKSLFGGGLALDQTLTQLIFDVIQLLLLIAGPLAVLFVIISGFIYMTSGGNQEQAEKGKKALINSIIGITIILLAYVIVTSIQNTINGM